MNSGQAYAILISVQREHPDLHESLESVMDYIAQLSVVADLARDNLNLAARKLRDDQIIPHNAELIDAQLDALLPARLSHGAD